jgi:hypothetical protein
VIATVALLALAVGGCETNGTLTLAPELSAPAPAPTATLQEPDDVKYFPSDEPLHLANEHFNRGDYGVAERYYREAVEKAPRDVTAWIGLAASYRAFRSGGPRIRIGHQAQRRNDGAPQ